MVLRQGYDKNNNILYKCLYSKQILIYVGVLSKKKWKILLFSVQIRHYMHFP